jgi:glycosyltransferase involved in cell wall biosynthesis
MTSGSHLPVSPRVAMVQDGSRLRYMVPLALQRAGMLERVFIDWFVRKGSLEEKIAGLGKKFSSSLGRRMAERSCAELDPSRVIRNPLMALRLYWKMRRFQTSEDAYLWHSHQTAKWILRHGFGHANAVYGFIRNVAPEVLRAAKQMGLHTCADQMIAPLEVEFAEMKRQMERWPDWSVNETAQIHPGFLDFERSTWEELDQITCASNYVRDGLISVGVAADRINVIAYPWSQGAASPQAREKKTGPLMVGFVGAAGLRKGAPWFLETARRFDPARVRFTMVGHNFLNPARLEEFSGRVQFTGPIPHSQVFAWLNRFDVFFFPTTCEGSATAVLEAMSRALPIITTPNSGSPVRDGVDGYVRAYDDVIAFREIIQRFDDDRELMLTMGNSARQHVLEFNLNRYQAELSSHFAKLTAGSASLLP